MIDPYKVLGIQPGATEEEIKKAYRKKAKEKSALYPKQSAPSF